MKILIDAFGGDNSPEQIVLGAIDAINEKSDFDIQLVGKKDVIEGILSKEKYDKQRVSILDAEDVITCEEEPTLAIRRKPNSSICVAFKALKEDESASAFVSAGSTGAVLVGATLKLGRIAGVNRPALCTELPTLIEDKSTLLLDLGANADCKAINVCQFAVMGSVYAKTLGIENPTVALLSNGTEDEKGNMLNHEVFAMLKETKGINFVGNCEARDILFGTYDVIVADGFSGNIALKSMEGAVSVLLKLIKQEVNTTFKSKLGGLLLKKAFKKIKKRMDYHEKGGALFVGVNKPVVKAHGSSTRKSFKIAVLQAEKQVRAGLTQKIKEEIAIANEQTSEANNS